MKNLLGIVAGTIGFAATSAMAIGFFVGWAYWMWVAIKIGSFGMFVFGLLGPLGMIAGILGLWTFLFGMPMWLAHLVT